MSLKSYTREQGPEVLMGSVLIVNFGRPRTTKKIGLWAYLHGVILIRLRWGDPSIVGGAVRVGYSGLESWTR